MLSPDTERPSLRELFHGSEEGNIPADKAKSEILRHGTPDQSLGLTMSPPALTREQTSIPSVPTTETSPARTQVSVEPIRFSPSQAGTDKSQLPEIANFSTPELCLYLEQKGCKASTLEAINRAEIDGEYWLYIFSMENEDKKDILVNSLHIEDNIVRMKLSSEASTLIGDKQNQLKSSTTSRPHNEKIPVPVLPKPLSGKTHLTYSQWESYRIAVVGWLQIGDKQIAAVADSLFHNPEQDLDNIIGDKLSQLQVTIDTIWAVQLLQSTYVSEWHTTKSTNFTLAGHRSGLKIIATVGKLVNKKTADRQLEALNEALDTGKEPVRQPAKLHQALCDINKVFNRMESLGSPADPKLKYTLLTLMVSELLKMPDMLSKLTIHYSRVTEEHPNDPDQLFAVLMDKAENFAGSSRSTERLRRPKITAAGETSIPICPIYREGVKECKFGANCHRRHEGRSGKICDTEDFKKYGLCPKISQCPHMHPWDKAKFGDRKEAIAAYRKILAEAKKAKAEKQITAAAVPDPQPEDNTTAAGDNDEWQPTDMIMAGTVEMEPQQTNMHVDEEGEELSGEQSRVVNKRIRYWEKSDLLQQTTLCTAAIAEEALKIYSIHEMDRAWDYCMLMRLNETPPEVGECYMVQMDCGPNHAQQEHLSNLARPSFYRPPNYKASQGAQLFKQAVAEQATECDEEMKPDVSEIPGTPPGITYDEEMPPGYVKFTASQIQEVVDCPLCVAVEAADEGYTDLKEAADYAYHLNQMRLYKIAMDESWDPETGSFNSRPSTPPTEMEQEEACMDIVAMMVPDGDSGAAEDYADNHLGNTANPAHTTSKMSEQDIIRLCQLAESEDFAQQMQTSGSDSETEEADYDSSDSDVGITAKIKMAWHPTKGTMVTVTQPDSKPSAEQPHSGCGWMVKRPAAQQLEQNDGSSSDKSGSYESNHLDSADAKILTKLQSQENDSSDKSSSDKSSHLDSADAKILTKLQLQENAETGRDQVPDPAPPPAPAKEAAMSQPTQGSGKRLKLADTEFEAEEFIIDMQWNNMSHQGHSAQQVGEWMKQSEKINHLVESHQQVAAALGPGHKVTPSFRAMATQSDIKEMNKSDFNIRLLLDGGTFNHNFGRDTKQYRVNLRKVEPIPIKTAGGIVWLDLMCDLYMPGIYISGGYVNDYIDITLISESVLAKKHQWTFYLDDKGKQVSVPLCDGYKQFWAQRIGNLFYIPLEIAILFKGRSSQQGPGHKREDSEDDDDDDYSSHGSDTEGEDRANSANAALRTEQSNGSTLGVGTNAAAGGNTEEINAGYASDKSDTESMQIEPEAAMVSIFDTREKEFAQHCRCGHRPYLPGCPSCEAGYMQAKPARASKSSRKQVNTLNIDLLDLSTPDNNGDRYVLDAVVQATSYGDVELMKRKASSVTVKHFAKIKNRIEALTAPGRSGDYQIERVHRDQGSEFEGAMKQYMDENNMINSWSEADRHTTNALVEQRNKALAMTGAAIIHGAVATDDGYVKLLQGESIRWANQIINNTPITKHQIDCNITAHDEQAAHPSPLLTDHVYTWGSLAYGFIPKDHRENKMSNRAFMGIWVGLDQQQHDSHRVVPILKDNGRWKLLNTKVCVKVKVYEGVFPLKLHPDKANSLPVPAGHGATTMEDLEINNEEEESKEKLEEGEYTVQKIVEHNHDDQGTEMRVRFDGYPPSYDMWFTREQLEETCKDKVDQYIAENEPEFTSGIIDNATAMVIAQNKEMNRLARETTVYNSMTDMPTGDEVTAMATLSYIRHSKKGSLDMIAASMASMVKGEKIKDPEAANTARALLIQEATNAPLDLAIKASNMHSTDIQQAALMAQQLAIIREEQTLAMQEISATAEFADLTFTEGGAIRNADTREEMNLPYIPFVDQYISSDCEQVTEEMISVMYATANSHVEPLLADCGPTWDDQSQAGAFNTGVYAVYGQQTGQPGQNMLTELSHQEIMEHIGKDMILPVGAVEIPVQQALADDREEAIAAIDKELKAMHVIRKRLIPVEEAKLTPMQKKAALECRFSITRKRITPEQAEKGIKKGTLKARLVAKDLKTIRKLPEEETYAGVPGQEAWRLIIASYEHGKHRISSTDFDTAYLQTPENGKMILIKRRCPFTGRWIYETCTGVIYGMQTGGCEWKGDITNKLTDKDKNYGFGFKELLNVSSVFYHAERDIIVSIHVDDPLIMTKSKEDEDWFHAKLRELYDVKEIKRLSVGNPIDYLSVKIQLHLDGSITLDNRDKICGFLEQQGMRDCKPVRRPLTKEDLMLMVNTSSEVLNTAGIKKYKAIIGEANWLSQTTHPTLATATSILAGYSTAPTEASTPVMQHFMRFWQHAKDYAIINRPGNFEGLTVESDSDWAGLYTAVGEVRSRSGTLIKYNGMPVGWLSKLQKCLGTSLKPDMEDTFANDDIDAYEIATSSAGAELHAAADSLKLGMHIHHVAKELNLPVSDTIIMKVDSTAAIGKIQGPRGSGKMKHLDLRDAWIQRLRNKKIVDIVKVLGTENGADFFTKLLSRADFCKEEDRLMAKID